MKVKEEGELPWFKLRWPDGREVEYHNADAGELFSRLYPDLKSIETTTLELKPPTLEEKKETKISVPRGKGQRARAIEKIKELLNVSDFLGQPKKLGEIKNELDRRGWFFDPRAIDGALKTLVRNGTLTRIGERGEYQYVKA